MLEKLLKVLKIHFSGEVSLKDGTPIRVEGDVAVGASVYVQSPDGEIPLPDGDYSLETGEVISVEEGKITNVTDVVDTTETPDQEVVPVVEEEMAVPVVTEEPAMEPVMEPIVEPEPNEEVENLKIIVSDLAKRLDDLESKINMSSEIESELRTELDFIKTKTLATELKKSKEVSDQPLSRMDIIKNLKNNNK